MHELQIVLENIQTLRLDVLSQIESMKVDEGDVFAYLDGQVAAFDSAIRVVERGITSCLAGSHHG